MGANCWYAISQTKNGKAGDSVEVSIYDEIGGFGVTAKDFLSELKALKGKHVDLRINSVGGSVIEGAAIYNGLRRHKGGLTVHVDGLAASMASVIAMAGDETLIADNAMLMIHNPWSMAIGDGEDLRKEADILDKLKSTLVSAYAKKTGIERAELERMMDDETWFDATEAVALGFADGIEDGTEAAASIGDRAARFDKFTDRMASKPKNKKCLAEEVAPQAEPETPAAEQPADETVEAAAVDTLAEVNMTAELQAKVDALQADLDAKAAEQVQAADEAVRALEAAQAEIARLSAEISHKDEELSALRAEQKSAGEQAAAICAAVGIAPEVSASVAAKVSAAEQFSKLTGAEATAFYRANKAEIAKTFYS